MDEQTLPACANCVHFAGRNDVRVKYPEPPKPRKWLWFTIGPAAMAMRRWHRDVADAARMIEHFRRGTCRRFPEHVERYPNDVCGEHTPQ